MAKGALHFLTSKTVALIWHIDRGPFLYYPFNPTGGRNLPPNPMTAQVSKFSNPIKQPPRSQLPGLMWI